jgi:serine/threonine protein kinase
VGQEQVLADRYALVSPLGRGGMGQVWEALDTRLDRRVAVKLLTAGAFAASPDFGLDVRRFTREASVTARFMHPSVPAIFDAGGYDDGLYLVMELIDGCTISDLLAEQGPLPVPWAAGIASQVAAVLAIAHRREILHRDIKPQNVMLTTDGTAKVLDFGVAGIISQRITSTGVTVGTPGYIAPEQLYDLPATPHTDLYALGCLLYEMLAGEPVFIASSPAGLIRMHLEQAPPPLRRRDVPPQLESLLRQLLAKDPAGRPADARQAYDLLLPFVSAAGPLGDIDPELGSRTGIQLYSRVLERLSGAGPREFSLPHESSPPRESLPYVPYWPSVPRQSYAPHLPSATHLPSVPRWPIAHLGGPTQGTRRKAGWTIWHSLWLLPTVLFGGFGGCLSFGYIAARHQRRRWLVIAAVYLALTIAALALMVTSPDSGTGPLPATADAGVSLLFALWPVAIIHALWVNFTTRLPLLARGRGG